MSSTGLALGSNVVSWFCDKAFEFTEVCFSRLGTDRSKILQTRLSAATPIALVDWMEERRTLLYLSPKFRD